ncbi:MAG: hypothetical protein GY718_06335 [Lentisphaerae bacterium]|nr:hypothetical protein [Lentisphaerota bacterium]
MANEWLTVNEAIYLTGKSEPTIRRWCNEFKNNKKAYKKEHGKSLLNAEYLRKSYYFVNDSQKTSNDDSQHKKEAMQIVYNSEIMKAQIDQLKAKDKQIEEKNKQIKMLINKKSYVWLIFFIIIVIMGVMGWFYRKELVDAYNSKITEITTFKDEIIKDKESNLQDTKNALDEIRTAYQQTLKAVDLLHVKYNDKIETKEKQYQEHLKSEQKKIMQLNDRIKDLEQKNK